MRIVAVGDNCVDVYVDKGIGYAGGGCVNFAAYSSRLGRPSAYVGALGKDSFGHQIEEALTIENVDTSHVQWLNGKTAVAFIKIIDGDRIFVGANRGVRNEFKLSDTSLKYISTFPAIHTTLDGKVDEYIPYWHAQAKMISYDFSVRATEEQLKLLPNISVAFFSGSNYSLETGREYLYQFYSMGCNVVVITFGEHGSLAYNGKEIYYHPAYPTHVVDTLGAGDAYQAAFMNSYSAERLIPAAMENGARYAAQVISKSGGFGQGFVLGEE